MTELMHSCLLMPEMKQWSQKVQPSTEVKEAEVAHEFPLWKPGGQRVEKLMVLPGPGY